MNSLRYVKWNQTDGSTESKKKEKKSIKVIKLKKLNNNKQISSVEFVEKMCSIFTGIRFIILSTFFFFWH